MLRRSSVFLGAANNNIIKKPILISFISDVEGCLDYFDSYVSRSRVLQYNDNSSDEGILQFRPDAEKDFDCHFVLGGDAFDKGPGDIRFATRMFHFQNRHPHNVHFILGNRDTNKLKLKTELNLKFRDQFTLPQPYYLNERAYVTYDSFMMKQAEKPTSDSILTGKETDEQRQRILLLKYILHCRMGSAELFEYRREELALGFEPDQHTKEDGASLRPTSPPRSKNEVPDVEVLNSFVEMSSIGGIYHEMMKRGKLALRIPKTDCAFVHGAINDDSFGLVPTMQLQELPYASPEFLSNISENQAQQSKSQTGFGIGADSSLLKATEPPLSLFKMIQPNEENSGIVDVDEWFSEMNEFKEENIKEWETSPEYDTSKPNNRRGGASLFGYGHGRCVGVGTSVEVSTYVRDGQPQHIGFKTAVALNLNGITRVAVGHQPIGDTPLILDQPGITTVMGDVSYGDKHTHSGPNGRGKASSEVLFYCGQDCGEDVEGGGDHNNVNTKTVVHGLTSQGEEFEVSNEHEEHASFFGKRSSDGWWSIGKNRKNDNNNNAILARKTIDAFRNFEQKWIHDMQEAKSKFVVQFDDEKPIPCQEPASFGFGQFFHPNYQAREDLRPTAAPEKPEVVVSKQEGSSTTGYFGKNKVKPKQ